MAMKTRHTLCMLLLAGGGLASHRAQAQAAPLPAKPAPAKLLFDTRLRWEEVDDDFFARRADAATLRLRLGYRTAQRSGWSGVVEFEGTTHLGGERYNSSDNGRTAYPAISDPDNAEINQAYLDYAPSSASHLRLGRQRLQYDNQRFIGNSGWRQNEQTFDALDAQHRFANGLSLRYSWLGRVQRVFGADNGNANLARWQLDAHLLSVAHALGPGTLTGYGYFIENRSLPLTSHRDLGLRYVAAGNFPANNDVAALGWTLAAELAHQGRYAHGSSVIGARYSLLEAGLVWRGNSLKIGREVLGGDGSYAFQTPLATLHAFNGWDDRFLTTPANGLQDRSIGWSYKRGKVTTNLVWHEFRSDHARIDYGNECDASVSWAFAPHWNGMLKLAQFRAGNVGADVGKRWLSVEYTY